MGLNAKSTMLSNYDLESLEAKSNAEPDDQKSNSMAQSNRTHEINIHETSESGRLAYPS
jgi:hypothetical protein